MQESFNPFAKKPTETSAETKSAGGLRSKIKVLSTLLAMGLSAFSHNAEGAEMPEKSSPDNTKNKIEQTNPRTQQKEAEEKLSASITKLEFTKQEYTKIIQDHEKQFADNVFLYQKYCEALKGIDSKEEKIIGKLPEDIKKAVTAYLTEFVQKYGESALKKFSEQGMVNEIVNQSHPVTGTGMTIIGTHSNPSTIGSTIKMFGDQNARLNFTGTGGVIEQLAAIAAREWFYIQEQQKIQLQATKLYAELKKMKEGGNQTNQETANVE